MKIGIDISQTAYEKTGVSTYLSNLLIALLQNDSENEYVLFFSSLRGSINTALLEKLKDHMQNHTNVKLITYKFPPTLLDIVWNRMHILPIENLIGDVDVFVSSDWTEPPTKRAQKVTILYDVIVYKYPQESNENIVKTQKRKLEWSKKEVDTFLCISEATKNDAAEVLGIQSEKLKVIYPGLTL
jgi:glycosyltransferase involved in cell wall biosynthesis